MRSLLLLFILIISCSAPTGTAPQKSYDDESEPVEMSLKILSVYWVGGDSAAVSADIPPYLTEFDGDTILGTDSGAVILVRPKIVYELSEDSLNWREVGSVGWKKSVRTVRSLVAGNEDIIVDTVNITTGGKRYFRVHALDRKGVKTAVSPVYVYNAEETAENGGLRAYAEERSIRVLLDKPRFCSKAELFRSEDSLSWAAWKTVPDTALYIRISDFPDSGKTVYYRAVYTFISGKKDTADLPGTAAVSDSTAFGIRDISNQSIFGQNSSVRWYQCPKASYYELYCTDSMQTTVRLEGTEEYYHPGSCFELKTQFPYSGTFAVIVKAFDSSGAFIAETAPETTSVTVSDKNGTSRRVSVSILAERKGGIYLEAGVYGGVTPQDSLIAEIRRGGKNDGWSKSLPVGTVPVDPYYDRIMYTDSSAVRGNMYRFWVRLTNTEGAYVTDSSGTSVIEF